MSSDIRDELIDVLAEMPEDDFAVIADAIIARLPWIVEPHEKQQVYITETGSRRLATRHVTPWTPSTEETDR